MDDISDIVEIIIAVLVLFGGLISKLFRKREPELPPAPPPYADPFPLPPTAPPSAPSPGPSPGRASWMMADDVEERLVAAGQRAAVLAATVRLERPNRRFLGALEDFVPAHIREGRAALLRGEDAREILETVEVVLDEIGELAEQRRDPGLRPRLGDADTLADACYGPIVRFAEAEGLPLTTGDPATRLGPFDLAIWTGFIPTSVAPIFLPRGFFETTVWWPAIAHEIGHDFLASVEDLDWRLRDELGLPSELVGTRPLAFSSEGLPVRELERVFGGWFEEIFSDVFGTLMCGPGYVAAMTELFASPHEPRDALTAFVDASGRRYDPHPPRHLRVVIGCQVLARAGFGEDARRLRGRWEGRHRLEQGQAPDRLIFPTGMGQLALPLEVFERIAGELVEKLYAGPLAALGGFGLEDVSGLDYGPHEHAEGLRAKAALLAGGVPAVRDPRAVITGAVLAALERPELDRSILERARRAIPGAGTGEVRPDRYQMAPTLAPVATRVDTGSLDAATVREAIITHALLSARHRR